MVYARIVVVGAGVSGLTTAVELKRTHPEYDITIVAKHLPGDIDSEYTSPFAGANWHSFATKHDKRLQNFDKIGYMRLMDLADNEPACGIHQIDDYCYTSDYKYKKLGGKIEEPWFKDVVDEYQVLSKKDLPDGVSYGYKYRGVVITTLIYLNFLLLKALSLGITVKRTTALKTIKEALNLHSTGKKAHIVVNCTGLLAGELKGFKDDLKIHPVLGQVVQIRNTTPVQLGVSSLSASEATESCYIMPRKDGGCILGGCFKTDFDSTNEDPELTKRIIQRAVRFAPKLIDPSYKNNPDFIDVVRVLVGQRPVRETGVRVDQDSDHDWLIHNYGAGPGGYQGSYGFSAAVIKLVVKAIDNQLYKSKL